MGHISDIKLIRTDTTLDLSQKAEKGMLCTITCFSFYNICKLCASLIYSMWDIMTLKRIVENIRICSPRVPGSEHSYTSLTLVQNYEPFIQSAFTIYFDLLKSS